MNILFADDYPEFRVTIPTLLRDQDHVVEVVENGRELLDRLARDHSFDLVITDNSMPPYRDITGVEVFRRIQGDDRLKHLPVIICSMSTELRIPIEKMGCLFVDKSKLTEIAAAVESITANKKGG